MGATMEVITGTMDATMDTVIQAPDTVMVTVTATAMVTRIRQKP